MSGRSRRVVQKKGAAGVAAALASLNAAREGTKRLDTFELKEEKAVYDVVDDEQYAQLVTKRRIEAGLLECSWLSLLRLHVVLQRAYKANSNNKSTQSYQMLMSRPQHSRHIMPLLMQRSRDVLWWVVGCFMLSRASPDCCYCFCYC